MSQHKIKFERHGKVMRDVRTPEEREQDGERKEFMAGDMSQSCKSINAAKRYSRALQSDFGALCVRAVR